MGIIATANYLPSNSNSAADSDLVSVRQAISGFPARTSTGSVAEKKLSRSKKRLPLLGQPLFAYTSMIIGKMIGLRFIF